MQKRTTMVSGKSARPVAEAGVGIVLPGPYETGVEDERHMDVLERVMVRQYPPQRPHRSDWKILV